VALMVCRSLNSVRLYPFLGAHSSPHRAGYIGLAVIVGSVADE
jgi:hypothetical protein